VCKGNSARLLLRAPDRFHGRKDFYQLTRCCACGLVRLVDPPSPHEMPFHYGQGYHKLIESAGETELARRWKRHRNTVLNLRAQGSILDIGCSSGAFLRTLRGSPWELHGVEISEQEAERARISAGAEVFVGDPLDAPFGPESFDVITCFHLLEHVYQPVELLKRIQTWLKPGGYLYVILPNIDSWEAGIFRSYWYGLELPRHLFHFSPSSLERAARVAQMRTLRLQTLLEDSFSEHSFHYILQNMLGKIGISKAPMAAGLPASFPVKVIRKSFRLSIESLFKYAASAAGRGASIEGLFVKE
jgi:2-polyprenyl-3-methyl-5-hydroxy-6-metoxy-1,4-benzoquinol methylase